MQSENRILSDLAKVANGVAGTVAGLGREMSESLRERNREWLGGASADGGVSRDEFEAVKAMAAAARDDVELLKARLAALEAGVGEDG